VVNYLIAINFLITVKNHSYFFILMVPIVFIGKPTKCGYWNSCFSTHELVVC